MITLKKAELNEIIKRSDEIRKSFKEIGVYGMPQLKTLTGELFEEWIADIKALILSLKQNQLTESILKLTEGFNGGMMKRTLTG